MIEIASETKTGTGPFKCLGFGAGAGVFIVGPFFSCRRMGTYAEDRKIAGNEHFGDDPFVLAPLKVGAGMNAVLSGPASRSNQAVEAVRVRSLVSVGDYLPTGRTAVFGGIGNPPFNDVWTEWHFQGCYKVIDL